MSAPEMHSALYHECATLMVLWRRDMLRFFREKMRIAGALLQPLIFWFVIGQGMSRVFRLPGAEHVSYREYFYPGVLLMVVLFTAIFSTMSVIEDRHSGFLQGVLVAPSSRFAMVFGKSLGGASVAVFQTLGFLLLAPAAGYSFLQVDWAVLLLALSLAALGLSALGFAIAWWLDSVQGYHVVMSLGLIPAWVLSGALFPIEDLNVLTWLARLNPLTYAVAVVRAALLNEVNITTGMNAMMLFGFALAATFGAVWIVSKR